jgi:hypothetical protein
LLTPAISSFTFTNLSLFASNAGHASIDSVPRAMLTPVITSVMATDPLPSQSPMQSGGITVADGFDVCEGVGGDVTVRVGVTAVEGVWVDV